MKTKQRNIRAFEIECEDVEAVRAYIEKNRALIEGLTIFLKGSMSEKCADICRELGLCYALAGECESAKIPARKTSKTSAESKDLFSTNSESIPEPSVQIQEKIVEKIVEKVVIQTVYVDKVVEKEQHEVNIKSAKIVKNSTMRSGEDIITDGDVSIFARVNSGAKIKADGCVEIFDNIDGFIECNGEYMLLKSIGKGTVIFGGIKLESTAFNGKLKRVAMIDGKVDIKEV